MRDYKFYKIGATILTLLVVIILGFIILGKKADNNISKVTQEEPTSVSSLNVIEEISSIDDTAEKEEHKNIGTTVKNDIDISRNNNTSNNTNKNQYNEKSNSSSNEQESKPDEKIEYIIEDPVFGYPVEGEICLEYAKDKLVYSDTLGEWITHPGVDIKAEKTTVVKASAAGTVKSIKNDPRYGLTVVIEHVNGYSTVYANLLTAEFVNVGENVSSGQSIGTVGNTASFEILDESHLHFEIIKDGEQIDPTMYLKN